MTDPSLYLLKQFFWSSVSVDEATSLGWRIIISKSTYYLENWQKNTKIESAFANLTKRTWKIVCSSVAFPLWNFLSHLLMCSHKKAPNTLDMKHPKQAKAVRECCHRETSIPEISVNFQYFIYVDHCRFWLGQQNHSCVYV